VLLRTALNAVVAWCRLIRNIHLPVCEEKRFDPSVTCPGQ
jgi:hypothetical protein